MLWYRTGLGSVAIGGARFSVAIEGERLIVRCGPVPRLGVSDERFGTGRAGRVSFKYGAGGAG